MLAIDWVFLAEFRDLRIRVLERNRAKLELKPDNRVGKFVDPLELLDCLFNDFRIVIWIWCVSRGFGRKARLEREWRAWSGNAVRESQSACRSSKSARLGLNDLAKVITRLFFCRFSR